MPRALEVAYIANTTDLERANTRAIASLKAAVADMTASGAQISASYGEMVASANEAGAAAAKHAAAMGGSLQTQAAAYKSAAAQIGLADDEIAASARMAGESAAKRAAAVGGALADQRAAYVQAAEAAKAEAAAATKAAEEASAAQVAAAGRAAKAAEEQSARISAAAKKIATVGLLVAGAAAYGIKKSADTLAELADETRKLHNVTGLSVESASKYAAVAKAQEIPVKALNQAFGTLSKNVHAVENAQDGLTKGAKTQENAFKQLGLPLSAISKAHGDLNKLLPQITQRFEQLPGSVNKAAIGMALFGRGWQTLVPLMHSGDLGLKEQLKTAERMGATLSGSTTQKLKEFAKQQEDAKYASLGLQLAIGQYVAPALTKLIHVLADTAHSLGDGVHWLEKHATAAKVLAGVIGTVLGGALTVYAFTKAKAFVGATQDMIAAMKSLAVRMGLTSAAVVTADGEMETANAAAAGSFSAFSAGAVASLAKIGGAIAITVVAVKGLEGLLSKVTGESQKVNELLGGNQPGEASQEGLAPGSPFWKKYGPNAGTNMVQEAVNGARQHTLDTGGGIMAFFMSKGLTAAQAAGIVGNVQQESSFNPNAPGGGLFQDIGPRAASGRGSITHQLEAAWRELVAMPGTLAALRRAHSPQEAARIFSQQFERPGKPELSNRERYALKAFRAHPQAGETGSKGEGGGYSAPSSGGSSGRHKARTRHVAAEGYMSPFEGASGLVRGREDEGIDFTARPGSRIGAIGGGVIDKIIRNWFKGQPLIEERLTSGSHKGQYVYYAEQINSAVREGQRVKAGQTIGTVASHGTGLELGFGHGGGMTLAQATTGYKEGQKTPAAEAFSKFLASLGKTGTNLEVASTVFARAINQTLAQLVTPAQQRALHGHVEAAGMDRAEATSYAGYAGEVGSYLQSHQAKWGRQKYDLSKPGDAATVKAHDEAPIYAAQSQKKYYEREVKALKREAGEWGKIRDSYRKFARHATGPGAKKEALKKAAEFDGKVKQAQKEAGELGGQITATEEAIAEAQATVAALPGEVQAADRGAVSAATGHVDLEVAAGVKTAAEGKAAKEAILKKALEGGYGALSPDGILEVKAELKSLSEALGEGTSAVEAHTQALKDATKSLNEFTNASNNIAKVENGSLAKSLADVISGQIAGVNYHGRAMTAGAGTAARY